MSGYRLKLTPPNNTDLNWLSCDRVPPTSVCVGTREWQDVCPNVIFSQCLYLKIRLRGPVSNETSKTRVSCHHVLIALNFWGAEASTASRPAK